MNSLEKTKRKRTSKRRTATIFIHRVEEALKRGSDGEELEERRTELKELDDEILDTLVESDEDEEIHKESDETNDYREKIGCAILAINEAALRPASKKLARSNSLESLHSLVNAN